MPWFFIDDHLAMHPKAVSAGNAAMGLWVRAGSWCAAHLTDGSLPRAMVKPLGGRTRDANRLVEVGLWDQPFGPDGDFVFRDWDHYQKSKAQVTAAREATRERVRKHRRAAGNAVTQGVTDGVTNAITNGAPYPSLPKRVKEHAKKPADTAEFEAFWQAYPKKADKGHARTAFAKALAAVGDVQVLIAGAEAYRNSPARSERFTKNAATWLNGECWADEQPAPVEVPGGRLWEE